MNRARRSTFLALVLAAAVLCFAAATPRTAFAQSATAGAGAAAPDPPSTPPTASPTPHAASSGHIVDGVAARIEDDILAESEVRELAAYQKLVDGQSKPRLDLIRELADQWIIRSEATTAKFPRPSAETLAAAYASFVKQFASEGDYKQRLRAVGLTDAAIRRILEQELYLSRFVEYRFRPAAQVDEKQIEAYYRDEFTPQLEKRNEKVPPLEDVEESIREVLVQRLISERANQWLDDARTHLKFDVVPQEDVQ